MISLLRPGHIALLLATLSIAALSVSCERGPSDEVLERRELVESIRDYDKRMLDERTVLVFGPCERDEYEDGERDGYFREWVRYAFLSIWDLDSMAEAQYGAGEWTGLIEVSASGPEDELKRLQEMASDEATLERWIREGGDPDRCPLWTRARQSLGLQNLPVSAFTWPISHIDTRDVWTIDRPALAGPVSLIYTSDDFRRMGFNNETGLAAPSEIRGGPDGATVLMIRSSVKPAHASQFLVEERYSERRTVAGSLYFTREPSDDADSWRNAIYFGERQVAFSESEEAIVELIEVRDEQEKTIGDYLPFSIVTTIGLIVTRTDPGDRLNHSSAIHSVLSRTAVSDDVEWLATGLVYGRDDERNPALSIAFYFEDPEAADANSGRIERQMMEFEASAESRAAGVPAMPFDSWCESITQKTFSNIDGSVLRLTCVGDGEEPMLWKELIEAGDLAFLR